MFELPGWIIVLLILSYLFLITLLVIFFNYRGQVVDGLKDSLNLLLNLTPSIVYLTFTVGIYVPIILLLNKVFGYVNEEYAILPVNFCFNLMFAYLNKDYKIMGNAVIFGLLTLSLYQIIYYKCNVLISFVMFVSSMVLLRICKSKIDSFENN
jgi:hypothetical protein